MSDITNSDKIDKANKAAAERILQDISGLTDTEKTLHLGAVIAFASGVLRGIQGEEFIKGFFQAAIDDESPVALFVEDSKSAIN